jgi:hypothetical protein
MVLRLTQFDDYDWGFEEEDVKEALQELLKRHETFYNDCTKMGEYPPIEKWVKDIFWDLSSNVEEKNSVVSDVKVFNRNSRRYYFRTLLK